MFEPIRFVVQGPKNPVRVVYKVLIQLFDGEVDKASFDRVAEIVGDTESQDGFLVQTMEDIERLCDIGNFGIALCNNRLFAFLVSEYQASGLSFAEYLNRTFSHKDPTNG
jgi:hypothetical protein